MGESLMGGTKKEKGRSHKRGVASVCNKMGGVFNGRSRKWDKAVNKRGGAINGAWHW